MALFPLLACSRSLFRVALLFRNAFLKNQDIAKGIAEPKSFRPPGRRLDCRPKSASWQILLIQRLDIGDANITHCATLCWFLCWKSAPDRDCGSIQALSVRDSVHS